MLMLQLLYYIVDNYTSSVYVNRSTYATRIVVSSDVTVSSSLGDKVIKRSLR